MLRFITVFFAILVIGVSAGLYHVKYAFDAMERQALTLKTEIAEEREAIRILEAEWSVLNRPSRLQNLTDRFLDLKPVEPAQIVGFSDLPAKPAVSDQIADAAAGKNTASITRLTAGQGALKLQ